jgi:hypothetical protein
VASADIRARLSDNVEIVLAGREPPMAVGRSRWAGCSGTSLANRRATTRERFCARTAWPETTSNASAGWRAATLSPCVRACAVARLDHDSTTVRTIIEGLRAYRRLDPPTSGVDAASVVRRPAFR